MKKYLIIVFGMILIGGCSKDCQDDSDLTADELVWLNCYTDGQTAIFKSNTGLYETLKVSKFTEYNHTNYEQGNCQHQCQIAQGESGGPVINVTHYNQYWTESYSPPNIGQYKFSNYVPQNNVIINGVTHNNVYVMDSTYYTKLDGVLAFPGYPGVEWYKIN